jgi:hypothetical protein
MRHMRWHKEGICENDRVIGHPSNDEAWKVLDRFDADFASDARNVHFGLVIDGFDPFSTNSALYYCWPVFVVPYTNYYGIINEIIEFSFTGKKNLK